MRRPTIGAGRGAGLGFALVVVVLAMISWSAAQEAKLSDDRLRDLTTAASSPEEHMALVGHYNAHAAEHEADAMLHEQLADAVDDAASPLAGELRHYAAHSSEAAEALRNLARLHEMMAME